MPALPSGRHVAVDPAPLRKLLLDAGSPFNAHHLMAIREVEDLYRWLDVLILKPEAALTPDERERMQPAAEGAPPGMACVPTGTGLADWQAVASNWSEDDRAAFSSFVDERIRPAMLAQMKSVRARQEALCKDPSLAGAFALMWRDGVHPLQDEGD